MNYFKNTLNKIKNSETIEELDNMAVVIETMTGNTKNEYGMVICKGWDEAEAYHLMEAISKRNYQIKKDIEFAV